MFGHHYRNQQLDPYAGCVERRPEVHTVNLEGNASSYTVDLNTVYTNVIRVELVQAHIVEGTDTPHYLIIKIDGMQDYMGNSSALNQAFCTLTRSDYTNNLYTYSRGNGSPTLQYTHNYSQPTQLRELRISFLNPDGTALTLDNTNHILIFEITQSTNYSQ